MTNKKPLYTQIQDYISQQITSGNWPPHYQIPPEREIADQFHVSRITAKNAMLGLVHEGLLYRHRGRGTFVAANPLNERPLVTESQPTVQSAAKLIGFIMPWMESRYSFALISGMEATLTPLSYHFLFKRVANRKEESQAIHEFQQLGVDGIILVTSQGEHFNDDIVRLVLNKFPVVMVEKTMRDIRTNGVYCITDEIGTLMVEYLYKLEVRQIGLVTYPYRFTIGIGDRISGFQSALVRRGMEPLSEHNILSISPTILEKVNPDEIPPEIIAFLQNHPTFDAIATVDALLAQFVGRACAKLNLAHIKIICCDEPSFHPNSVFPVAYIDQSPFEMGSVAAKMIVDSIENHTEPSKHAVSPRLIEIKQ